MHSSFATASVAILIALAADLAVAAQDPPIFTNASCTLSSLNSKSPIVLTVQEILTPLQAGLIGTPIVNDIQLAIDELCTMSEKQTGRMNLCEDAFTAVQDLAVSSDHQTEADKYKCLIDLLCIAHHPDDAVCQVLLDTELCVVHNFVSPEPFLCDPTAPA